MIFTARGSKVQYNAYVIVPHVDAVQRPVRWSVSGLISEIASTCSWDAEW
jgi:hypothetical protein